MAQLHCALPYRLFVLDRVLSTKGNIHARAASTFPREMAKSNLGHMCQADYR
jgi:hypothetical protein